MARSLIAFDADRIKRYIFATGTLKEIRGASRLLVTLNHEKMQHIVSRELGGTCYYAAGGSGLFSIEAARANEAIQRVQQAYAEYTGGAATITGVAVELPADFDEQTGNAQKSWQLLGYRLQARKARNPTYHSAVTHPLLRPGDSDGNRYAVYSDNNEAETFISRAVQYKRTENDRIRRIAEKQGRPLPEDFDAIARASSPHNYFALLVADGDRLGQAFDACRTLPEIQELATGIHNTLEHVVNNAAAKLLLTSTEYDVLLQGGDDLVVALPAHKALDFALLVTEGFTQQTQQKLQQTFTLSTSVVWAHTRFPFGAWHDLAESALKFTKQQRAIRRQENPADQEPLINFLVISSANHLDFGSYYDQVLTTKEKMGYQQIIRTMRPYTVPDLRNLMSYRRDSQKLADISRSKLEALRRAIFQSSAPQAILDALHVLVHWRGQNTRRAIHQLLHDYLDQGQREVLLFPFVQRKKPDTFDPEETMVTYRTPLADLAEVWDFIPGGFS